MAMGKVANFVEVNGCKCIAEVLEKSGTDWEPDVKPIASLTGQQGAVDSNRWRAVYRPDTGQVLGCVTNRYNVNSHVYHVAKLDRLVRNGDLVPAYVSVWDNGRMLSFQFRAPVLDMAITEHDKVSPLLTLAFFHDGKGGDMSFFSDFRWFCKNQLGKVADANKGNGKAYHRGDVSGAYDDMMVKRISELGSSLQSRYAAMRQMTGKPLGGRKLLDYFSQSLGVENAITVVDDLWRDPNNIKGEGKRIKEVLYSYREDETEAPGTVWQAFNGVTRYVSHVQGRNDATRSARALLGPGQDIAARAFQLAAAA